MASRAFRLLWLLAVLAAAPGSAFARTSIVRTSGPASLRSELTRAARIGEHAFGPTCARGIAVTWRPLPGPAPGLPGTRRLAQAEPTACRIALSSSVYRSPAWRRRYYAWPWLCSLVVHEYGHLAGRAHSAGRLSPMFPLLWRVYGPCVARRTE